MHDQPIFSMLESEGDSFKFFVVLSYFTTALILVYAYGLPYLSSVLR